MPPRRGEMLFRDTEGPQKGFSPEREPGFDGCFGKPVVGGPSTGDYLRLNDRSSLATSGLRFVTWEVGCWIPNKDPAFLSSELSLATSLRTGRCPKEGSAHRWEGAWINESSSLPPSLPISPGHLRIPQPTPRLQLQTHQPPLLPPSAEIKDGPHVSLELLKCSCSTSLDCSQLRLDFRGPS